MGWFGGARCTRRGFEMGGDRERKHEAIGAKNGFDLGVGFDQGDEIGAVDQLFDVPDAGIDPMAGDQPVQPAALAREDDARWFGGGLVGFAARGGVRTGFWGMGDEGAETLGELTEAVPGGDDQGGIEAQAVGFGGEIFAQARDNHDETRAENMWGCDVSGAGHVTNIA